MGSITDLVCYASANMPADDSATSGGAIDPDVRVAFTPLAADDDIEVVSSAAGDTTQSVTVRGRKLDGTVAEQTVTLNGTTAVILSTLGVVARVLKVSMSADAAGVVTVRRSVAGTTVGTIPVGERGFLAVHREFQASATAGTSRYYKVFWKNTHATDSLNSALVSQSADPAARVTHALATSKGDSGSVTNRTTAPAGLTFDDTAKVVPTGTLAPGETIGVWLKFTHPQGEGDLSTTYTLQIEGTFP